MKKTLFSFLLLLAGSNIYGQKSQTEYSTSARFYHEECETLETIEEKKRCASEELLKYVYKNVKYPGEALEAKAEGIVVVRFVIYQDGWMADLEIVKDLGYGTGEEVIRVLKEIEDSWIPAMSGGEPKKELKTLPVRFKLP